MIRAGIIGGAGYTAGELVRLLVNHPAAEVAWIHSESQAGKAVAEHHPGLVGDTELVFTDQVDLEGIDVLFLCSAHGKSRAFWAEHPCPAGLKVIDLAQDFRDESDGYVYGLPELNRNRIAGADKVANPGCFATAIQLSLLPLAKAGLLEGDIHVQAVTGSTGAGVKPSPTTHFSWRDNNLSAYKVLTHQHLAEIRRNLGVGDNLHFVPVRGGFPRGIFAVSELACSRSLEEVTALYQAFYADAPFTFVLPVPVDLKQVVNTNKCLISLELVDGRLVVTAVIDNLLKGASGQAVENLNLLFSLPETAGLRLKALAF
ncbi:MAG: N-acetyl-gamma-glutamyl-phosphate reductase [Bacteroidales bacterium]|jgi:N-acetyl-gamma-glutamyl-phosphate reductase, common form|nr:N-acetyl-gamma-glutamyl-phosphate reductase [Bacteroidales bacterium]MBR6864333.1 N-acetyl-gamma-glutamyl-phosphate reductase [Bacteroidales bacterium]